MSRATRRRAQAGRSLVGFTVNSVNYAVPIEHVQEIINPLPVVPLPHAPAAVLGLANHRGDAVPIIDLRARLGLPSTVPTRRTKWLLVVGDKGPVGLVVDQVTEVFGPGEDARRQLPSVGIGDQARGLSAVYEHEEGLVYVIDVRRMTAAADGLAARSGRA